MTARYVLIGHPLDFSLSPALHRAAYQALGLDADYLLLPTAPVNLASTLSALRRGDYTGANVTVPHKQAALAAADEASALAEGIGAANTLVRLPDGGLRAENTDVAGFAESLAALGWAAGGGRRALVLGAGGGARAAACALLTAGFRVSVAARRTGAAGLLAGALHRYLRGADLSTLPWQPAPLQAALEASDLLVQATPMGGAGLPADPLAELSMGSQLGAVIDLVAWPPESALVLRARREGRAASGGLTMLVGQAAAAIALWTGHQAPREVMLAAALARAGELAGVTGPVEAAVASAQLPNGVDGAGRDLG